MSRIGIIALVLCSLLTACASLPENYEREQSWKLDGSDSRVAAILEADLAAHPGLSGVQTCSDSSISKVSSRVTIS